MNALPIIRVAALCERVLQEKDGALSLIRVVDRYTLVARGPNPPTDMPAVSPAIVLVLSVVAGDVRGRHEIQFSAISPSGQPMTSAPATFVVDFQEDHDTKNWVVHLDISTREAGTHWLAFTFDGQPLTRLPLRIVYRPERQTAE